MTQMMKQTVHAVEAAARERPPADSDRPFDPRHFEQALRGLQELVVGMAQYQPPEPDSLSSPDEEVLFDTEDEKIAFDEDTALMTAYKLVPKGWDVSVLVDKILDNNYILHCAAHCGGGVEVRCDIRVDHGFINWYEFKFTDLADEDRERFVETNQIGVREAPHTVAQHIQRLERAITQGYLVAISSAVKALDYAFGSAKETVRRGHHSRNHFDITQSEWAVSRGTTRQTVSNNINAARDELNELPGVDPFLNSNPALIEVPPDSEDADIKLV